VKMDMELDPMSYEAREGRKGASRPRTRSTGSMTGPPVSGPANRIPNRPAGPNRTPDRCQPGAVLRLGDPFPVAIRPRARSGPDAPVPGPVGPDP
jgi:hypothetical protein